MVTMSLGSAAAYPAEPGKFWVFVGTYTDGKSKGIYRMVLDTASGKLSEPMLAAEAIRPVVPGGPPDAGNTSTQ